MAERASMAILAGIVLSGLLEIVQLHRQLRRLENSTPTRAAHLRVVTS
ncbi:MAG: hypothetical protein M3P96_04225 [Actinomycetota bacterium]|nr:hypothetical protein [Actinomycetota bacterium]